MLLLCQGQINHLDQISEIKLIDWIKIDVLLKENKTNNVLSFFKRLPPSMEGTTTKGILLLTHNFKIFNVRNIIFFNINFLYLIP